MGAGIKVIRVMGKDIKNICQRRKLPIGKKEGLRLPIFSF